MPEQFLETQTWVIVLVMSFLMCLIFIGMLMIYLFYQKMKELYRMQQNFINGFTHELKTPVASLQIFLETFSKYNLNPEEQKKYIGYMLQDTKRLADNVDRILKMGKIEEKKYQAEKKICDVASLVNKFFRENSQILNNVKLKINIPEKQFYIYFDTELFEIILANLVSNAINYKSDKELEIGINVFDQNKFLRIEFVDNGVGITKENLKKVFRKFYQVEKNSKGTGIGLFLVSLILKIHKSSIEAKSDGVGAGSCFILKIPLNRALVTT